MTEKQKIFCDEYLKDLNATRAYKVAYPNVKKDTVAATNGGRTLRNAEVKNSILIPSLKFCTTNAQQMLGRLYLMLRCMQMLVA